MFKVVRRRLKQIRSVAIANSWVMSLVESNFDVDLTKIVLEAPVVRGFYEGHSSAQRSSQCRICAQ